MTPLVSFIIPCPPHLEIVDSIASIENLDYPKDRVEIIIERGTNPSAQRNRGIRKAKGEFVAFIDSDVTLERNWLDIAISAFDSPEVALVGGPNLTPPSDPYLAHCFGYAMSSYFGTATMSYRYSIRGANKEVSEQYLILSNMCCRRSIFDEIGYFNEQLFPNEENELMNRINMAGYKNVYISGLVSYHPRKRNFKGFVRQLYQYGEGRASQTRLQPGSFKMVYALPSVFSIYALLLPIGFALNSGLPLLAILGLVFYLILAILASAMKVKLTRDLKLLFILPPIFFILHMAYGFGFIKGLFKKMDK